MRIYLAPIQGTTDRIYRSLYPAYFKGVDLAIAPFIPSVRKITAGHRLLNDIAPKQSTGLPTIPQIMSSNPDDFARLANYLHGIGYGAVNWNLGCPFRMVVKKGRGSGMLCYPDRIEAFLEKAMPELKPALSIKLRLGTKSPDDILRLIPIFNRFDLEELIIHPRTGAQMYDGTVDLDTFEQCLRLTKHRVVYNGDIDSAGKLDMLAHRFGSIDRWMIGRGILENPFLPEEIKFRTQKPYAEKIRILRKFHDRLFAEYAARLYGPSHLLNKMKEIWTYMGGFIENGEKIRKKIRKLHSPDHYTDVVNRIFDELVNP